MYTTISQVRELSGLDDATNVLDSVIQGKIQSAAAMFESAIFNRYELPLVYHRQNTLTFSGTGSGSGTMAIIVNGTTYNISITTGLTAAQAADLFRESAIDSTDFIVALSSEKDEQGEIVTLISRTSSSTIATASAEVNITSATTVQGISGTIGTRSDRYSPLVSQIVAEIAAALLLQDNYGIESENTSKDGDKRIEAINKVLLQLQGELEDAPSLRLIDEVTKTELSNSIDNNPSFFPTTVSKTDTDDPTSSKIGINKQF